MPIWQYVDMAILGNTMDILGIIASNQQKKVHHHHLCHNGVLKAVHHLQFIGAALVDLINQVLCFGADVIYLRTAII